MSDRFDGRSTLTLVHSIYRDLTRRADTFVFRPSEDISRRIIDYDDYTKFINDTFTTEKTGLLNETIDYMNKTGGFAAMSNPMEQLLSRLTTFPAGSLLQQIART